MLGQSIFGEHMPAPCPALITQGGVSSCGIADQPSAFVRHAGGARGARRLRIAAKLLIGAGLGCDAQDENEPFSPTFDADMTAHYRANHARLHRAAAVWGLMLTTRRGHNA
jgi:hypothetical protein